LVVECYCFHCLQHFRVLDVTTFNVSCQPLFHSFFFFLQQMKREREKRKRDRKQWKVKRGVKSSSSSSYFCHEVNGKLFDRVIRNQSVVCNINEDETKVLRVLKDLNQCLLDSMTCPGVNFINVLWAAFVSVDLCWSYW